MNYLIDNILNALIRTGAIKKDSPKTGVNFFALDPFFNDPALKAMVKESVLACFKQFDFDGLVPIASRGYLFSGLISGAKGDLGEFLIQKVKAKGDPHYVQLETKTEYSSDALQLLKNSVKQGGNYLVVDDLIATGGSIKTAVELIKKCGGKVDTVFVFTELVDFGARQALENDGIHLVSTLKFTNDDLNKLLHLQACYQEMPLAPISYQLSQYKKGEQALIKSNGEQSELTVHLASMSPIKKEAIELAAQGIFAPLITTVNTYDPKSEVSEQPFDKETQQGASNRLNHLEKGGNDFQGALLISIENGIRYNEDDKSYYDFVHIILKKDGVIYEHTQNCCKIPLDIVEAISKDESNVCIESWGDVAKRMGRAEDAKDPHKECEFGGISRKQSLFKAMCHVLCHCKEAMMAPLVNELDAHTFAMNRLVKIKDEKATKEYKEIGVNFLSEVAAQHSRPINFYTQGAPVQAWHIDAKKIARNHFKVFQTGDAFSVISPDVEVSGANITIHVGINHETYSPLVLFQEALQLCRCAYEHGARSVTVALPDDFHPVVHYTDFNHLLVDLFKASGVNTLYYYGKEYKGKLDESNRVSQISLTLSEQGPIGQEDPAYHVSKRELRHSLNMPSDLMQFKQAMNSDDKMLHFTRRDQFQKLWSAFYAGPKMDVLNYLSHGNLLSKINIPDTKLRPHMLLCGTANKSLAKDIATDLRLQGEMVQLYNIEGQGATARIPNEVTICGSVVTIIQSTHPSPDNVEASKQYKDSGASSYLFEAALIARQAHLRGAIKVNLINPYQFGARSDKAEDNQHGKTGAYVQHNGLMFKASGVNLVSTAEPHDNHTRSGAYTGDTIRGSVVSALSVIATRLAKEWLNDPLRSQTGQFRLVTPDAGAAKRTSELALQLEPILKDKLSKHQVRGEKERSSHNDNSAEIKSLSAGGTGINPKDKHFLTDDETATGSTLCQAITALKNDGAIDISVIVVHNNMPLDWLLRQLCLARFLYLGVNDLHFSDTNEMGFLAKDYNDLIESYAQKSHLSHEEVERSVVNWFTENVLKKEDQKVEVTQASWFKSLFGALSGYLGGRSDTYQSQNIAQSEVIDGQKLLKFKSMFGQFHSKIRIHSLSGEFASKVITKPYMSNPYAFNHIVNALIDEIKQHKVDSIVVFEGASVAAASATAEALNLPLQVLPLSINDDSSEQGLLPHKPFVLLGTASQKTLTALALSNHRDVVDLLPSHKQGVTGDIVMVPRLALEGALKNGKIAPHQKGLELKPNDYLSKIAIICESIKQNETLKGIPIKLLGVDVKGQAIAGKLSHALSKQGIYVGIAAIEREGESPCRMPVYAGQSGKSKLVVDRNSINMGEVGIVVANDLTLEDEMAMNELISNAEVKCPFAFLTPTIDINSIAFTKEKVTDKKNYSHKTASLFFKSGPLSSQAVASSMSNVSVPEVDTKHLAASSLS